MPAMVEPLITRRNQFSRSRFFSSSAGGGAGDIPPPPPGGGGIWYSAGDTPGNAATARVYALGGEASDPDETLANVTVVEATLPEVGFIQAGQIHVESNNLNVTCETEIRINGAVVLTVTIPNAFTGILAIPGSVAVAIDDQYAAGIDPTASNSGGIRAIISTQYLF